MNAALSYAEIIRVDDAAQGGDAIAGENNNYPVSPGRIKSIFVGFNAFLRYLQSIE